jgi:phosphomannomutase/phosphoglucomutase
MLFIKDILTNYHASQDNSRNDQPKKPVIIYDIKSTNNLKNIISTAGGMPLIWKTGHSLIKAKMKEQQAVLAGEMSGHVFFNDRWFGFDDGLYTAARLLELVLNSEQNLQQMCEKLPENQSTPELIIKSSEGNKQQIVAKLIEQVGKLIAHNKTAKITTIDGLRVDFVDSWGLVRFSNTTPNLIARFEGKNLSSLNKIKNFFKYQLLSIDPDLVIPF